MQNGKVIAFLTRKIGQQQSTHTRCRTSQAPISLETATGKTSQAPISLETKSNKKEIPAAVEPTTKKCPVETTQSTIRYLPFDDIPGPKPSLPFIGTGWQYFSGSRYSLSDLHAANADKFRRFGPIVKEEFQWRKPMVQLYDPYDFETMFRFQGVKPNRPENEFITHYRQSRPDQYDSPGLSNMSGEEWLVLKRALSAVLMKLNVLGWMLPPLNSITDDFIQVMHEERDPESGLIRNFQSLAYRMSLEAIYEITLESRLGCLNKDYQKIPAATSMIRAVQLLFESYHELYFGLPLWKFYPTKSYKKLMVAESTMYEAVYKRIEETLERVRTTSPQNQKSDSEKPGIMQKLLEIKELSDKEIVTTIIDLISGGIFTVSNSFTFLLYHISRHPEVQEKLYKEVIEHASDGEITLENLKHLRFLKACVKESFRLTPTIPGISRLLPEDVLMSGYAIPANTHVFCNFVVSCQDRRSYPDAESYRPDRWINGNDKKINKFTLVPFGFGSRMCVGRRFAEMEMYIALAKIIKNFRLESTGQAIKSKMAFIIVPSEPVSLYAIRR